MTDSNRKTPTRKAGEAPKPALNFLLMGAGSMFTATIVAGFLVGYVLDMIFETTPIFMMICGVMGFIGGIQKVQKLSSKLDPLPEKEHKDDQKS